MAEDDKPKARRLLRVSTSLTDSTKAVWDSKALSYIRPFIEPFIPGWNFITIHYAYFIFTSLLFSVILWGSATPSRTLSYTDALFLSVSAMTEAGLNTVNLSELNTFQQACLLVLIVIGSAIPVSAVVVFFRLGAFEKAFRDVIKERKEERRSQRRKSDPENDGDEGSKQDGSLNKRNLTKREPPLEKVDEQEEDDDQEKAIDLEKVPSETTKGVVDDTSDPSSSSRDGSPNTGVTDGTSIHREKSFTSQHSQDTVTSRRDFAERTIAATPNQVPDSARSKAIQVQTGFTPIQKSTSRASRTSALTIEELNSPSDDPWPRRRDRSHSVRGAFLSFEGVGALAAPAVPHFLRQQSPPISKMKKTDTWLPTASGYILRNSQFMGLTLEEREKLGGLEYTAIAFLAVLVPTYMVMWQLLAALAIGGWVKNYRSDVTEGNGLNPFWVGAFNAISAFNNSGMSLLDANMTAFSNSIFILLCMGLFILAGNTAFPLFLRLIVWVFWKILPSSRYWKSDKEALRFLLDHPRRCYTNMFPSRETWYLLGTIIVLNGIDWAMYPILNIGNSKITADTSTGIEVVDGLFQALAVRSGGFYVVPIPNLRAALQVLYLTMMYISVYPVAITMRNSNVYEDRSLGIDAQEDLEDELELEPAPPKRSGSGGKLGGLKRAVTGAIAAKASTKNPSKKSLFVRHQIRAQLSHDIWAIVFAVFLIMIIEASQFEAHPTWFSIFNVIFEVVSGYACVGMSIGVPYNAFSFSGSWHVLSKLILCAVMLRGRHRGLPIAIDQAIQLPGSKRNVDEDGKTLLQRRNTERSDKER